GVARAELLADLADRPRARAVARPAAASASRRRRARRVAAAGALPAEGAGLGPVLAILVDGVELGALDVVGRARVARDVRVGAQVLNRLRVAGNRVHPVDPVVVEPVVDDGEPAAARRLLRRRG